MSDNAEFARKFLAAVYPLPPVWAQVLNVVGEAGEFAEAYRRYTGHARRNGSLSETGEELADVVISAYVAAERLGIGLDAFIAEKQVKVMTRGFKEQAS